MAKTAPNGTTVLLDDRLSAVMTVAAASAHYRLRLREKCPAEPFVLFDPGGGNTVPAKLDLCDSVYILLRATDVRGMPGIDWALYAREPIARHARVAAKTSGF
jgi:hypothetical protein